MRRDAGAVLAHTEEEGGEPLSLALAGALPALVRPALESIQAAAELADRSPEQSIAYLLLARASITEALNTAALLRSR